MSTATQRQHDSDLLSRRALQVQRGGARAAVLGVNDGLVSTLCIVLGVAGAGASRHTVLLAGLAGLVAGAISMAAGEWISVKAQVELFQGVLKDVRRMLAADRALLVEQVEADFAKRVSPGTAKQAAHDLSRDDEHLFTVYVANVIGINPDELGSPWTAALSSFGLFTAGSVVALAPWFFSHGPAAVWSSIIFTALGSLLVGGYIGRSGGNSPVRTGLRQLAIVALASAVTYGVGTLFGTAGLG